jgi:hypothetical protein
VTSHLGSRPRYLVPVPALVLATCDCDCQLTNYQGPCALHFALGAWCFLLKSRISCSLWMMWMWMWMPYNNAEHYHTTTTTGYWLLATGYSTGLLAISYQLSADALAIS